MGELMASEWVRSSISWLVLLMWVDMATILVFLMRRGQVEVSRDWRWFEEGKIAVALLCSDRVFSIWVGQSWCDMWKVSDEGCDTFSGPHAEVGRMVAAGVRRRWRSSSLRDLPSRANLQVDRVFFVGLCLYVHLQVDWA